NADTGTPASASSCTPALPWSSVTRGNLQRRPGWTREMPYPHSTAHGAGGLCQNEQDGLAVDSGHDCTKQHNGAASEVSDRGRGAQSCRTTLSSEELIVSGSSSLYSMNPSLLNLFRKKFTRARVVPTISASVSCEILGTTLAGLSSLP